MMHWQSVFSKHSVLTSAARDGSLNLRALPELKSFLDVIHVRHCLARPFQERGDYPLVEARELLPSFDTDMLEHTELPGFALVAFGRQLDYFSEIFQYDKLYSLLGGMDACPLENQTSRQNIEILASRLPKKLKEKLRAEDMDLDATLLDNYEQLLPYLLQMDRAHVLSLDQDDLFHLSGVFASFPSDIDNELKRFGLRIGKFVCGDSEMYARNRMFVYQYLMELYGFPIVSERRTSSALFARRLHKIGENFLLRVLGQTDRTLTTYISEGDNRRYPRVEKIALLAVEPDQTEAIDAIGRKGFFLDEKRRVVIIRVCYRQHRYDAGNLRQDRALSVASQEILHPLTGDRLGGLNIIKDTSNMFLRLNDIVRGEYTGRIIFKRAEIVENTDTDEKRLKFLYNWLNKHQRRVISYSDEFYENVNNVIGGYLNDPARSDVFDSMRELFQEVRARLSYVRQARRARVFQDISRRSLGGERITYRRMCAEAVALLTELQFEIVNFFPDIVDAVIATGESILHDSYLRRKYIIVPESSLTEGGKEIKKNYGRLVSLLDAIKAVRKARLSSAGKQNSEVVLA